MNGYGKGRIGLLVSLLGFLALTANFAAAQGTTTGIAPIIDDQTLYIMLVIQLIVTVCLFAALIALIISLKRDIARKRR